jgi:hypothetical protein
VDDISRLTENADLGGLWEEMVVAYFNIQFCRLHGNIVDTPPPPLVKW